MSKIHTKVLFPLFNLTIRSCSTIGAVLKPPENKVVLNKDTKFENSIESPYFYEDGLRKVYPYFFQFEGFCKGRWINQTLFDMYSREFIHYPKEDIMRRISEGFISVNGEKVSPNYVLKNADFITSFVHRHELPVLACPINILFEDENLLVVDKPPSMPVHPCGLYFQNSVVRILGNEYNLPNLQVLHRLDRLTSGVLIFTKCSEKSRSMHDEMLLRFISKEYICRVEGKFPDDRIFCDKPIKHFYNRVGAAIIHPRGKVCVTEFVKLNYNGNSSLVLCKPLTGRTHQIRAHLQYLGFPILNDPIYNNFAFGPNKGKDAKYEKSVEQVLEDLCQEQAINNELYNIRQIIRVEDEKYKLGNTIFKEHYNMNQNLMMLDRNESRFSYYEKCYFCKLPHHNPVQTHLGLFLHASKYKGADGWEFSSNIPFWASDDFNLC